MFLFDKNLFLKRFKSLYLLKFSLLFENYLIDILKMFDIALKL